MLDLCFSNRNLDLSPDLMISDDLLMVDYLAEPFKIASQSFSLTLHVSLCGVCEFIQCV